MLQRNLKNNSYVLKFNFVEFKDIFYIFDVILELKMLKYVRNIVLTEFKEKWILW